MTNKSLFLIAAMAAGVALTSTAEARGFGDQRGGPGMRAEAPSFEELDLNGDGSLTLAEIEEAMEALRAARFSEADTDSDGALSAEEMMAAAEARNAERMQERAARMIERLDADGDGLIQLSELPEAGDRGRGGPERMFARLDANEDGLLDAVEYAQMGEHRRGH